MGKDKINSTDNEIKSALNDYLNGDEFDFKFLKEFRNKYARNNYADISESDKLAFTSFLNELENQVRTIDIDKILNVSSMQIDELFLIEDEAAISAITNFIKCFETFSTSPRMTNVFTLSFYYNLLLFSRGIDTPKYSYDIFTNSIGLLTDNKGIKYVYSICAKHYFDFKFKKSKNQKFKIASQFLEGFSINLKNNLNKKEETKITLELTEKSIFIEENNLLLFQFLINYVNETSEKLNKYHYRDIYHFMTGESRMKKNKSLYAKYIKDKFNTDINSNFRQSSTTQDNIKLFRDTLKDFT